MPDRYPPEFRRKVLDLVAAGRRVAQVATDLDISEQTIYELWELIEPLIPERRGRRGDGRTGRPRVADRAVLAGIVFVLATGISWNDLPAELGCGSGTTCWRRLRDWQRAGVWQQLHRTVLDRDATVIGSGAA